MKVDFTVSEYKRAFRSPLPAYFRSVAQRMSKEVREIFEKAKGKYISGEMALWDILTSKGVNPILAAELSIVFPPDPIIFDPGILRAHNMREIFEEQTSKGNAPLEVLVNLAEFALMNSFVSDREKVFKVFQDYVAEQRKNYA